MGRSFTKTADCRELLLNLEGVYRSDLRHTRTSRVLLSLPPARVGIEVDRLGTKWVLCRSPLEETAEQDPVLGELLWLRPSGKGVEAIFLLEPNSSSKGREAKTLLLRVWSDRATRAKRLFTRTCYGESVIEEWFTSETLSSRTKP
jgi:hypothetical protein